MDKRDKIRSQIQKLLQRKGDQQPIGDQDSLILSGRLDSLNVLEIVEFLEQEFQFNISCQNFELAMFDSLDSITALV